MYASDKTTHCKSAENVSFPRPKLSTTANTVQRLVAVYDPTDDDMGPIGKQTRRPSHIFYRSCSGIWQTVWMEAVPNNHITGLDVTAGMDGEGEFPCCSL
jgi:hypothetical protein